MTSRMTDVTPKVPLPSRPLKNSLKGTGYRRTSRNKFVIKKGGENKYPIQGFGLITTQYCWQQIFKSESTKYPGVLSIISYNLKPRKQALATEVNVSILGRQLGAADATRCMRSAGSNGSSSQGSNFGVKMQLSREEEK